MTRHLTDEPSRAILARQLAGGFVIGGHSINHKNLRRASSAKIAHEIEGSIRELVPLVSRPIGLFRPPFGALGHAGTRKLRALGLTDVRWSIDTRDWQANDPARLQRNVLAMILKNSGGVVLMHDSQKITATVITGVLDDLEAENCRRLAAGQPLIVPVSLHYFLTDRNARRPLPAAVERRTEAYKHALPGRCASRPAKVNDAVNDSITIAK
ncbi:MAG: polysaccharide deacetylase family protein [Kofleriaceae bacterium]